MVHDPSTSMSMNNFSNQQAEELYKQLVAAKLILPKPLSSLKANMSHSRIAQQIEVLTLLESTIGNAGKVTMTPTRVKIMSEHREGNAIHNQKHMIDLILQSHGMLPFTVELVRHG